MGKLRLNITLSLDGFAAGPEQSEKDHATRASHSRWGGTMFHLVTEGIDLALERARAVAGEMDVSIGGGANVVQQDLGAGLLDEHLVPG